MITVVQYLVIAAVIGAVMFGIAIFVFGRGEQMAPLPARVSPVELPASGLRGDHVRRVRFSLALRGYRMSDVDWTLERLADEIDVLHDRLEAITGESARGSDTALTDAPAGTQAGLVHRDIDQGSDTALTGAPAGLVHRDVDQGSDTALTGAPATGFPEAGPPAIGTTAAGDADQASTR